MVKFRIKPLETIGESDDSGSSSGDVGIIGRIGLRNSDKALLRKISVENREKVLQRYKDTSFVIFEDFVSGRWATDDLFGLKELLKAPPIKPPREKSKRQSEFVKPKTKRSNKVAVSKPKPEQISSHNSSRPDSVNKDIENIQAESQHNKQQQQPRLLEINTTPAPAEEKDFIGTVGSLLQPEKVKEVPVKSIPANNLVQSPPPRRKRRCIVS